MEENVLFKGHHGTFFFVTLFFLFLLLFEKSYLNGCGLDLLLFRARWFGAKTMPSKATRRIGCSSILPQV